jgi:acetylornithine deacetylase/succinyl-diaminopimelate desuccinylase-like protein
MTAMCETPHVVALARLMVACDSRSIVSNFPLLEQLQARLPGWEIERIDYTDDAGLPKANLVARWPVSSSRLAFAGHTDTVTDAGWETDPFSASVEDGNLVGLGATDMKGPLAAMMIAAMAVPEVYRPLIVLTADEETTKRGVREVVARSMMLREYRPACFIVCEPTDLRVARGHRVDVQFVVHAHGLQAHSSTGKGVNANLQLIPFLAELRRLHTQLRQDTTLHDAQYDPPYCDLNFTIDNYGTLPNTTVGLATCRIKFRYSKSFDPAWVIDAVSRSAETHGLELFVRREAPPPELPPDAPLVRLLENITSQQAIVLGIGTEASEYSRLAPSLILGPGNIDQAHKPGERIAVDALLRAVTLYRYLAKALATT